MANRTGVGQRWDLHRFKVSDKPRWQLAWVLGRTMKALDQYTPGDLDNFAGEIAVFLEVDAQGHFKSDHPPLLPNDRDIRDIHSLFCRMIEKAIDRADSQIGTYDVQENIRWDSDNGRFVLEEELLNRPDWPARVKRRLSRLIVEWGHLLKRCPAPALRASADQRCGKWFLAARPNQEYCSASCQTRLTSRAARLNLPTYKLL